MQCENLAPSVGQMIWPRGINSTSGRASSTAWKGEDSKDYFLVRRGGGFPP
jgi:hypothetical protein